MLKRKIEKEIIFFVIGLAIVSCLGVFIRMPKFDYGLESIFLFLKNFATVFFGLGILSISTVHRLDNFCRVEGF